jgi:hypothetical protein
MSRIALLHEIKKKAYESRLAVRRNVVPFQNVSFISTKPSFRTTEKRKEAADLG